MAEQQHKRARISFGATAQGRSWAAHTPSTDMLQPPNPQRFGELDQIGSGAYGTVFRARCEARGADVALKRVTQLFEREYGTRRLTTAERTLRELAILRATCAHPQIVGFHGCLRPSDPDRFDVLWLSLEVCWKDLGQVLALSPRLRGWSLSHVKALAHQLLCGLAFLHRRAVVHRDLKPSNLLVTNNCRLKICDFGLARKITPPASPAPAAGGGAARAPLARTTSVTAEAVHVEPAATGGAGAVRASPPAGGLRRQLTQMVVTRWYRAPELFCLEENYTAAIDTCMSAPLPPITFLEVQASALACAPNPPFALPLLRVRPPCSCVCTAKCLTLILCVNIPSH